MFMLAFYKVIWARFRMKSIDQVICILEGVFDGEYNENESRRKLNNEFFRNITCGR